MMTLCKYDELFLMEYELHIQSYYYPPIIIIIVLIFNIYLKTQTYIYINY